MKRTVILLSLCFAVLGWAEPQTRSSPFEGCWIWDGASEARPEITELIFKGNVLLGTFSDPPIYMGDTFTYTGMTIELDMGDQEFQYFLYGDELTIITRRYELFLYKKASSLESPLEGIWKVAEGSSPRLERNKLFLFTRDILAVKDYVGGYYGLKIDFRDGALHPSLTYLDKYGNNSGEQLMGANLKYRLVEKTLILHMNDEDIKLTKEY